MKDLWRPKRDKGSHLGKTGMELQKCQKKGLWKAEARPTNEINQQD
jgi:hypothetical protein